MTKLENAVNVPYAHILGNLEDTYCMIESAQFLFEDIRNMTEDVDLQFRMDNAIQLLDICVKRQNSDVIDMREQIETAGKAFDAAVANGSLKE